MVALQFPSRLMTERLVFDKLKPTDAEAWLQFYKGGSSTGPWSGPKVSPEMAWDALYEATTQRYIMGTGGLMALRMPETQHLIGVCGLSLQDVNGCNETEIGYSILPKYRRLGFAYEAAYSCMQYAFRNDIAPSLVCIVHIRNRASQALALKLGMRNEHRLEYKGNPVYLFRIPAPQNPGQPVIP